MNSLRHENRLSILNAILEFRSEVINTLTWRKDGVFACGLIRENEDSKMSISPNNSCFCGQTKEQGFLFLVFFFSSLSFLRDPNFKNSVFHCSENHQKRSLWRHMQSMSGKTSVKLAP